ncbi:cytochrome c-type biogenesis protein CcmF [Bathymodiolus platifrons methanotrophic gill symbiont]|uniref:heme lyase CcmF/NrfE family subunit n=1 Tax=Bathymodiolus platifrons methanotrophic gill symbiont TaxID=113268 RepID=UPI0011C89D52|nr:heme lyase CcmF/NrfE family subunit [Bathymodiolus platifrons methanotrophic gill symbiont]TXK99799.1 heme lyase NrfEFG subunit NrfE [Methylococcaceae bacterium HT1]TXL23574.1 heme lyase NrfEFG subunit NrfE [Methylococcaceae bacterium HT2]GFO74831.1 cytochrome c-type biogenesis protein CcmF [Bathymodiolus platifrons methanotrophic gill symbiont]
MIPEIGEFALIIALFLSAVLALVPMYGAATVNELWMSYAKPLAKGQFLFMLISFICLGYAFSQDDFSVIYVAQHSNSQMPIQFKLSAIWGGHEGSLLLWAFILSGWTLAVSLFSRSLPLDMLARFLSVMGIIATGFISFLLVTSSPFLRHLPSFPEDGADLNPLLQDFGLIVHPPLLYMGYVGFSVVFSFAIAALLSGRLDTAWARWSRPWTNIAWAFLGLGITLGSWWAYYELGWGGWWFWDPVENASLMPWLVGTALVHSLAATEKRGVFKSWTLLLAIFAFSLSLLGTFLVRSGVLTSVHAFASDPERGFFILMLLAITMGGSLTLYAFKAPNVKSESNFSWLSREVLLLVNNVFLTVMAVTVLLGTLYPLLIDALGAGKISVGPPYFNAVFVPIMGTMAVAMGISVAVRWRETSTKVVIDKLWLPAAISILCGLFFPFFYGSGFDFRVFIGISVSLWVISTVITEFIGKFRNAQSFSIKLKQLPFSYYGMMLAHIGVAVTAIGITLVSTYSEERDIRMAKGDSVELAGYQFIFQGTHVVKGPNYVADQATIELLESGNFVVTLHPEKRRYNVKRNMMTEADIDAGLFRDLYVALGEPLNNGEAWAVRVHYKPYVRWLWLGGILMALGGLLTVADKRYRQSKAEPEDAYV